MSTDDPREPPAAGDVVVVDDADDDDVVISSARSTSRPPSRSSSATPVRLLSRRPSSRPQGDSPIARTNNDEVSSDRYMTSSAPAVSTASLERRRDDNASATRRHLSFDSMEVEKSDLRLPSVTASATIPPQSSRPPNAAPAQQQQQPQQYGWGSNSSMQTGDANGRVVRMSSGAARSSLNTPVNSEEAECRPPPPLPARLPKIDVPTSSTPNLADELGVDDGVANAADDEPLQVAPEDAALGEHTTVELDASDQSPEPTTIGTEETLDDKKNGLEEDRSIEEPQDQMDTAVDGDVDDPANGRLRSDVGENVEQQTDEENGTAIDHFSNDDRLLDELETSEDLKFDLDSDIANEELQQREAADIAAEKRILDRTKSELDRKLVISYLNPVESLSEARRKLLAGGDSLDDADVLGNDTADWEKVEEQKSKSGDSRVAFVETGLVAGDELSPNHHDSGAKIAVEITVSPPKAETNKAMKERATTSIIESLVPVSAGRMTNGYEANVEAETDARSHSTDNEAKLKPIASGTGKPSPSKRNQSPAKAAGAGDLSVAKKAKLMKLNSKQSANDDGGGKKNELVALDNIATNAESDLRRSKLPFRKQLAPLEPIVSSTEPTMSVQHVENAKTGASSVHEGGTDLSNNRTKVPQSRLLSMATKGEWSVFDQIVRALDKHSMHEINEADKSGLTPLMVAVKESRISIAERLLDLGADVNAKTKYALTPLHYAAMAAKEDMIKLLLNRKADANAAGGVHSQLPLHMACTRIGPGTLNIVQLLLRASSKDCRLASDKEGRLPLFVAVESSNGPGCQELLLQQSEQQLKHSCANRGDTVLHVACRQRNVEIAKILAERSPNINITNDDGHTPFFISVLENDEAMVRMLHSFKANASISDKDGRSPLYVATERGFTAITEILVDKFKVNISGRTADGSTLMHVAASSGNAETAQAFFKKGVPLNMPNKFGHTGLHVAAIAGHVTILNVLLGKGALIDSRTKDLYTALHLAVEHGKHLAVQTLLGYGAKVDLKGGKAEETPLHIAARVKGGERCAEMLIKSGADINACQENGETALHIASRFGHISMVEALLSDDADSTVHSKVGESALHVAVRCCHQRVVVKLLKFAVDRHSRDYAVSLVNLPNNEGETAVHLAAQLEQANAHEIMRLLLEFNGDVNVCTKQMMESPLHYLSRCGNKESMMVVVQFLGPARTQLAVNRQTKSGASALLVASEKGHLDIVNILLQNNARVDVFDEVGKAALHLAAENGHEDVAAVLLSHKAFVGAKTKLGKTPLHLAAENGYVTLVEALVMKFKAMVDALTLKKRTPLHLAASNGQKAVVATLLRMSADPKAVDSNGDTPLHLAAENNYYEVVRHILKHNQDLIFVANSEGRTCVHIAASKGNSAVMNELMAHKETIASESTVSDTSAIHQAAAGGHADIVRLLVDIGVEADQENSDGMTPLHLAAKFGHVSILEVLEDKVSLSLVSSKTGFSAIHIAAEHGQLEFLRQILGKVDATMVTQPPKTDTALWAVNAEHGLTALHLAAESGHEALVRMLLNLTNISTHAATAHHGLTSVHMAAQNGHTDVVSLLLSRSAGLLRMADKRDRTALHLAAANGHREMCLLLIGQGAEVDGYDKNGWTPIHYAAKAGHLPIVQLLVESGAGTKHETMENKMPISLAASAGHTHVLGYLLQQERDTDRLLADSKFMLDLMVAAKSHDYLLLSDFILTSPAPVETAVWLSAGFRNLATREKARSHDLDAASEYCESMAVELMSLASDMNAGEGGALLRSVDRRGVSVLDLLIECEQKQVVAHETVQKYLSEIWIGRMTHWASWRVLMLFVATLLLPPVWIVVSLPLGHRLDRVPVVKFINYLVSHIYLIGLFIVCTVAPPVSIYNSADLIPHWYEWLLLAWLSGLVVAQLTNPSDRAGLGIIKLGVIGVCIVGVTVHVLAAAFDDNERLYVMYARNQLFAFAMFLCFVQLLDFLTFHHLFGPWALIIQEMVKDLFLFVIVLAIFLFGFTFQVAAMYVPATAPLPNDPNLGDGDGSGGIVVRTPLMAFEMLFFAQFGLVDPQNMPPLNRNPWWAVPLLKSIIGVYMMISFIMLVNLLIAMMSDTYAEIDEQSDTEWKFGRAKLFRNMNKTSAAPSPINLVTKLFTYIKILVKHGGNACRINTQRYVNEEESLDIVDAPELTAPKSPRGVSTHGSQDAASDTGDKGLLLKSFRRGKFKTKSRVIPVTESSISDVEDDDVEGMTNVEDVVSWENVVEKYLSIHGREMSRYDNAE